MKKNLRTPFSARQYMLSPSFELYYYNDTDLTHVASHIHNYYEFCFFLEGNVTMQINGEQYPLIHGDVLLIPPGLPHHSIIHNCDAPYRRFVFWISREFFDQLTALSPDYGYVFQYACSKRRYIMHHDQISFNILQSKLIRLLEEMQGDRFCREAQISLCVNDLILHLNRTIYERNHPVRQPETAALYQTLCNFIETHIEEDLSLDRLSAEFFVSKYHIAHMFKDNLGISIHQYITKKRLSLCQQAIQGDMSITEAYQAFGFGDYSSFFRAFKKEYGISPREYKDMHYIEEGPAEGQM